MRFCTLHWDRLRTAIDVRGLTPLCSTSGEEAHRKMKAELEAGQAGRPAPKESFDPLLGAHNAILANATSVVGEAQGRDGVLAMLGPKEDGGEWCPICYLLTCTCGDPECPKRFESWIDRAADDMLTYAKEKGLLVTH